MIGDALMDSLGGASGLLELVLGAAATPLTRVRRNAGYENQGFADLIKLWAGEASLTPGDIDAGPKYAFLAIDAQASLWEWMARLGQAAGVHVWMDAEGRLNARAARGQPVATWGWGRDLLGLQAELHDPAITAFAGLATGKAKEGAWSAGEKPAGGAAAGAGGSPAGGGMGGALGGALGALSGGGAKPAGRVHITVPGCPALDIASPFALEDCPGGRGDGDWVAIAVEHRFAPGQGFITRATGVPA